MSSGRTGLSAETILKRSPAHAGTRARVRISPPGLVPVFYKTLVSVSFELVQEVCAYARRNHFL